jgi:peptidoglycan/LPS O-acetylase OafA/YrhL
MLVFASHGRGIFLDSWRASVGIASPLVSTGQQLHQQAVVQSDISPSHQAVIVFFVLSGYFVGGSVLRSVKSARFEWRVYLGKRMSRLWLVLIPALLLTVMLDYVGRKIAPAGAIYSLDNPPISIGPDTLTTFIGNMFFLQRIYLPPFGTNAPLWSLAYEFWFYVAFPFAAMLIFSRSIVTKVISATALILMSLFVGTDISAYFSVWLLGLVAHIVPAPKRCLPSILLIPTWAGVVGFALILIKMGVAMIPGDIALGVIASAWCYQAKHSTEPNHRSVYARLAIALSEMSYTLYLVHVPILTFLSAVIVGRWHRWHFDMLHISLFAGIMFITFASSVILYLLFERNTGRLQQWVSVALTAPDQFAIKPRIHRVSQPCHDLSGSRH